MGRAYGTRPDDVIAAIGPSIGPCCYEVGPDLVDAFAAARHERYLIQRWFASPRRPVGRVPRRRCGSTWPAPTATSWSWPACARSTCTCRTSAPPCTSTCSRPTAPSAPRPAGWPPSSSRPAPPAPERTRLGGLPGEGVRAPVASQRPCDNHGFSQSGSMSRSHDPHGPPRRSRGRSRDPPVRCAGVTFRSGEVILDRFRVIRFIARGGMGEVYGSRGHRARRTRGPEGDPPRDRRRHARQPALPPRSAARAQGHASEHLPHLRPVPVPVAVAGRVACEPIVFVTMELLEGETLAQRLKRDGQHAGGAGRAARGADGGGARPRTTRASCTATSRAATSCCCRGRAPATCRASSSPTSASACSVGDSCAGATISMAGELIGTPDYMAPEQIEGAPITPATDVYALGVVMDEMVTGVRPFVGDTPMATALQRIAGAPPKPPRDLVATLPPAWNATIVRCPARQPAAWFPRRDRPQGSVRWWCTRGRRLVVAHGCRRRGRGCLAAGRRRCVACVGPGGATRRLERLQQAGLAKTLRRHARCAPPWPCWASATWPAGPTCSGSRRPSAEMLTTELGAGDTLRTTRARTSTG